jgi:hypothetical protein
LKEEEEGNGMGNEDGGGLGIVVSVRNQEEGLESAVPERSKQR